MLLPTANQRSGIMVLRKVLTTVKPDATPAEASASTPLGVDSAAFTVETAMVRISLSEICMLRHPARRRLGPRRSFPGCRLWRPLSRAAVAWLEVAWRPRV